VTVIAGARIAVAAETTPALAATPAEPVNAAHPAVAAVAALPAVVGVRLQIETLSVTEAKTTPTIAANEPRIPASAWDTKSYRHQGEREKKGTTEPHGVTFDSDGTTSPGKSGGSGGASSGKLSSEVGGLTGTKIAGFVASLSVFFVLTSRVISNSTRRFM